MALPLLTAGTRKWRSSFLFVSAFLAACTLSALLSGRQLHHRTAWLPPSNLQLARDDGAIPPLTSSRRGMIVGGGGLLLSSTGCSDEAVALPQQPPPLQLRGSTKPMPAIGFGTCCRATSRGEPLQESAGIFLDAGGKLIDTAQVYGNHPDVAIAIIDSALPREDLWITSKVLVTQCLTAEDVVEAVDSSLDELKLDYLDLMLLHGGEGWNIAPARDLNLWKGLLEAQRQGKARNIGVSNHNREEIQRLVAGTGVTPAVNQLEYHPWVGDDTKDLVRWCQDQGIAVTAYGSLGGSRNKAKGAAVTEVAQRVGKTNAQVLLRWALDRGVAVIPGATTKEHILENLQLADFSLSAADAKLLETSEAPGLFRRWRNCKSGCAS